MKKILVFWILILCFFPVSVFASGNISVSTSNISVVKGSTKSFSISANNAAGRVDVSVSNSSIASISDTSLFLDNQNGSIVVKGLSVGSTSIRVAVTDATTYDDEDLSGKSYTINVTVTEPINNNNSNSNNNSNKMDNSTNKPVNNKSNNNDIKEISVEGYELTKVDNTNYTLQVSNNVTSISVKATASDSKATILGNGSHDLKVGENKIEVIVTSESGIKKTYNIKIIRKDGYYLDDLDIVLKDNSNKDINIIIDQDSKISSDELTKIKNNGKIVNLNYYDKNKLLMYSWTIDGKEINDIGEFITTVTYISEQVKDISKLSNYADGLYVNFKHDGNLPKGTKIKLYVGDKFDDDSLVNVYYYNRFNKRLDLVQKSLSVKSGYVEFDIEHCSDYFVTMSNVALKVVSSKRSKLNVFLIVSFVEFVIIIILLFILDRKRRKKRLGNNISNIDNSSSVQSTNSAIVNMNTDSINQVSNINNNINTSNNVNGNTNVNSVDTINK